MDGWGLEPQFTGEGDAANPPDQITVNIPPPLPGDRDSDGTPDDADICPTVFGSQDDADFDGLLNDQELRYGTNRCSQDTDGDRLTDAEEVELNTNPLDSDTDDDRINDLRDLCPNIPSQSLDSDSDGLPDDKEGSELGMCNPDVDGDGLRDGEDPDHLNPDTDGDGVNDGEDSCPTGIQVDPNRSQPLEPNDLDGDFLSDAQEREGVFRSQTGETFRTDPCTFDTDQDGRSDGDEVNGCYIYTIEPSACAFINPLDEDSDDDGVKDGEDPCPPVYGRYTPGWVDSDFDGLSDPEEGDRGSSNCHSNADQDGFSDRDDEYPLCRDIPSTRAQIAAQIVNILGLSFAEGPQPPLPPDVDPASDFAEQIRIAINRGIFTVNEEGDFCPNESVIRAAAAAVCLRGLEEVSLISGREEPGEDPWRDVHKGDWFNEALRTLWSNGFYWIVPSRGSYGQIDFHPEDPTSRCLVEDFLIRDGGPPSP